jgi:hypothetical protein
MTSIGRNQTYSRKKTPGNNVTSRKGSRHDLMQSKCEINKKCCDKNGNESKQRCESKTVERCSSTRGLLLSHSRINLNGELWLRTLLSTRASSNAATSKRSARFNNSIARNFNDKSKSTTNCDRQTSSYCSRNRIILISNNKM